MRRGDRPTPQRKGWRRKQLGGHTLPTCPLAGPFTTLGFPLSGRRAQRSAGNTRYVCFILLECFPLLKKPVRVRQQALFSWLISPLGRGKRECKPCLDHQQHASSGGRKRCIDDLINKTNQEREMIKYMSLPLLKEF